MLSNVTIHYKQGSAKKPTGQMKPVGYRNSVPFATCTNPIINFFWAGGGGGGGGKEGEKRCIPDLYK